MAKKNLPVVTEKANLADARWINTPFSFAQFGKDFSLLQQHVMIKMSDHLQDFLSKFFRDGRNRLPDDPLSLFPDEMLDNLPQPQIMYSEFGVDQNNSAALYAAISAVMSTHIYVPETVTEKDENGNEYTYDKLIWKNVFIQSDLYAPKRPGDKNYKYGDSMTLKLNPDVVKYAFNMRLGYVNHPIGVASDSKQEYAPRLYFSIKHRMVRGKNAVVVPYDKLREETGMKPFGEKGETLDERYPHFSKFRLRVIDPAIADINRMASLNLIDICIEPEYKLNYAYGKTKGDPVSIEFTVKFSKLGEYHRNPKKAREHMDSHTTQDGSIPKADTTTRKRGRPRKISNDTTPSLFDDHIADNTPAVILGDRVGEWQQLVQEYGDGPLASLLQQAECQGTIDGAFYLVMPSYQQKEQMVAAAMDERLKPLLVKYSGRSFKTIQTTSK